MVSCLNFLTKCQNLCLFWGYVQMYSGRHVGNIDFRPLGLKSDCKGGGDSWDWSLKLCDCWGHSGVYPSIGSAFHYFGLAAQLQTGSGHRRSVKSRHHEDVRRGDGCYPAAKLKESEEGLLYLPAVHPRLHLKSDKKKTARNLCLKGVTCQALKICLFPLISNLFVIIFTFLIILDIFVI